jgi:putative ABC transport system permease protein
MKLLLFEIYESIIIALEALKSNKIRSFLASLGVVIGISIVILMGWLIEGLDGALNKTWQIVGQDMLYIDKYDWSGGTNWKETRNRKNLKLEYVEYLKSKMKSPEMIAPVLSDWGGTLTYEGKLFKSIAVTGSTYEIALAPPGNIEKGRFFNESEDNFGNNVIVIGHNVKKNVFKDEDPIGKSVKIKGHKFTIIGVIKQRGTVMFNYIDNECYIPTKRFSAIYGKNWNEMSIAIKAGGSENLDKVRDEAVGYFRMARRLAPNQKNDFAINEAKAFEATMKDFKTIVYSIGIGMTLLSFLVGIIGIMNIMFVSVVERTKEIGIRKAIGAKGFTILTQFIVESAVLCLLGSIMALIFCNILTFGAYYAIISNYPDFSFLSPYLPIRLIVIASLTSIFVGLIAGFIPAIKASKMHPVDSLRYE